MSEPNCLFCRIVRGEIPAKKVFENEHVLAFRDIHPQAPTHILVIPKIHLTSLEDLVSDHGELHKALLQGMKQAAAIDNLGPHGYRVVTNIGQHGGQSVPHLHFHVLGGRQLGWPPG